MKKIIIGLLSLFGVVIVLILGARVYKDIGKKRAFENTYAIQNVVTGKTMRVEGADIADGARIVFYDPAEWECMTWRFIELEEDTFLLQNLYTQKTFQPASTPAAGVELWQQSLGGTRLQYWEFLKQVDETYLIRLRGTELYLAPSSNDADASIVLLPNDGSDGQRWRLVRQTPIV